MEYVIVLAFVSLLLFLVGKFADSNRYSRMTDAEYEAEAKRASKFAAPLAAIQKLVDPEHHVEYVQEEKEEKLDQSESGEPWKYYEGPTRGECIGLIDTVIVGLVLSLLGIGLYSQYADGNRKSRQRLRPRRPAPNRLRIQNSIGKSRRLLKFQFNDGGREAAGYKGKTGDCVVRSVAITTGLPYQQVYDSVNNLAGRERTGKQKRGKSNARTGVYKGTTRKLIESLGWRWTPTMEIGSGCTVHLRADELPKGRLIVSVSGHLTAVIDGVIHDTHDPSRQGTRCVYGYWQKESK
jgi:hypothetical protein